MPLVSVLSLLTRMHHDTLPELAHRTTVRRTRRTRTRRRRRFTDASSSLRRCTVATPLGRTTADAALQPLRV